MSAKKKPLRPTGEGDTYRAYLRQAFLRQVADVVPEISEELVSISPMFNAYMATLAEDAHSMWWELRGVRLSSERDDERGEPARALLEALHRWALPYQLHSDDWIAEHALHHLWRVSMGGADSEPLGTWAPAVAIQFVLREPPVYEPPGETRADYMQRVEKYVDDVEADYRAGGWEPIPSRWRTMDHLQWLARHQCLGLPYDQCDRCGDGSDPSTVRRAIKKLAKALPLTLRPERGRKVGTGRER